MPTPESFHLPQILKAPCNERASAWSCWRFVCLWWILWRIWILFACPLCISNHCKFYLTPCTSPLPKRACALGSASIVCSCWLFHGFQGGWRQHNIPVDQRSLVLPAAPCIVWVPIIWVLPWCLPIFYLSRQLWQTGLCWYVELG